LLALAENARADPRPIIAISVVGCPTSAGEEVPRIAAIELHAMLGHDDTPYATIVHVECAGALATVHIADPLTSKSLDRSVSLAGLDSSALPRTLALAVAELASASWAELETNPNPTVPPLPPRAPAAKGEAAKRVIERLPITIEAVGSARVFVESGDLGMGGGIRVRPWVTHGAALRFELDALHADGSRTPGYVDIDTASLAAAGGIGATSRNLRLVGTLGLRAGLTRIAGTASSPNGVGHVLSGGWIGPELAVDLELFPGARVHPVISQTIGWAVLGVDGIVPGDRDIRASGPWFGFTVGLALN
jgi:hypothetical protein